MDSHSQTPSFGAALVGFAVASFLCGCMLLQLYIYVTSEAARLDSYRFKVLIAVIWLIDIIQLFILGDYVYGGLIIHNNDTAYLALVPWSFAVLTVLNVCVSTPVQMFYAWRVYILGHRNLVLPLCICLTSLLSFSSGTASAIFAGTIGSFGEASRFVFLVDTWLGADIFTDFLIVSSLYYFLTHGRTGFSQTDLIIDKIVFLVINTGLAPTILELGHLLAFTIAPNSFAHLSFNAIVPKLYANSFMATLNARNHLLGSSAKSSMPSTIGARLRESDRYEMPAFAPPRPGSRRVDGTDILDVKVTPDNEGRLTDVTDRETGSIQTKSFNGSTFGSVTAL